MKRYLPAIALVVGILKPLAGWGSPSLGPELSAQLADYITVSHHIDAAETAAMAINAKNITKSTLTAGEAKEAADSASLVTTLHSQRLAIEKALSDARSDELEELEGFAGDQAQANTADQKIWKRLSEKAAKARAIAEAREQQERKGGRNRQNTTTTTTTGGHTTGATTE